MSEDEQETDLQDHDGRALHYVVDATELADGERVLVDVAEREVAVFRLDGEYYALLNFCTHQGGPACEGRLSGYLADEEGELVWREDEVVSCPWHGWEFDVRTGEHLASTRYRLPTYDVVERDGKLYVAV